MKRRPLGAWHVAEEIERQGVGLTELYEPNCGSAHWFVLLFPMPIGVCVATYGILKFLKSCGRNRRTVRRNI